MINADQFLREIIRPTLSILAAANNRMAGPVPEALLLGTAMVESNLTWLRQHPRGPALGVYQMEPATYRSHWLNWIQFRPQIDNLLRSMTPGDHDATHMIWNLRYATAMARIHYWMRTQPLPQLEERGLAAYYLVHYNTVLGKSTAEKSEPVFRQAIAVLARNPKEG